MCRDELPGWQKKFKQYQSDGFTVVGIAMDVEGVEPARRYYEKHGVTFHTLVDPNYATRFGYVPYTFFVDEHGVVQETRGWEKRLRPASELKPVTEAVRRKFTDASERLRTADIARLANQQAQNPADLAAAAELASRYLQLDLRDEVRKVLQAAVAMYDARRVAQGDDGAQKYMLANAHLQLARAYHGDRDKQVEHATLSFYLNPSVGFGKQIARIIAPEKFDDRADGRFDNTFREGTLTRLRKERAAWLEGE